mmetsp:Transcript_22463/g.48868  ORF Transcript_22463/g.48868 Transcript_22463/m.48868 type:complete len:532 (+) Transcript_22463:1-1596(+)
MVFSNRGLNACKNFNHCVDNRQGDGDGNCIVTDNAQYNMGPSMANKKRSPRDISRTGRNGEMRSCSSINRRKVNCQEQIFREANESLVLSTRGGNARKNFIHCDDNRQGVNDADCIVTDNVQYNMGSFMANDKRSPRAILRTGRNEATQSSLSISRRRRTWGCGDSLAGSCIESKASIAEGYASFRIPREVSLEKPPRSRGLFHPKIQMEKRKFESAFGGGGNVNTEKGPGNEKDTPIRRIAVLPSTPNSSSKSRLVPFSPTYCCGKCKGCRRTLDCQTCDACLEKLYWYGSQLSLAKDTFSPCLLRRCQRTCRVGNLDSLLEVRSTSKSIQSNSPVNQKEGDCPAQFIDKSVLHLCSDKNPMATKNTKLSQKSALKNMKAPWDDGDDWTVDYSYLSEPEYRRYWSNVVNCSGMKKASASTKSLSTPSWWFSSNEKQSKIRLGGMARASLSSVSESVISREKSTKLPPSVSISTSKQKKRKGKGVKRKRDPLHGLALPGASRDACSVTSWRENRKCLRALMEYDEADQNWV